MNTAWKVILVASFEREHFVLPPLSCYLNPPVYRYLGYLSDPLFYSDPPYYLELESICIQLNLYAFNSRYVLKMHVIYVQRLLPLVFYVTM